MIFNLVRLYIHGNQTSAFSTKCLHNWREGCGILSYLLQAVLKHLSDIRLDFMQSYFLVFKSF